MPCVCVSDCVFLIIVVVVVGTNFLFFLIIFFYYYYNSRPTPPLMMRMNILDWLLTKTLIISKNFWNFGSLSFSKYNNSNIKKELVVVVVVVALTFKSLLLLLLFLYPRFPVPSRNRLWVFWNIYKNKNLFTCLPSYLPT